jgi:hypothetical protein
MAKPTKAQVDVLVRVHAWLNALTVSGPGVPDTPAAREARRLRTDLEEAFGRDTFEEPPPSPIVPARG